MQVQGGIFPTKVVIHNCSYKEVEWVRNIDLILFRFPSRKKDGSYDIDLATFSANIRDSLNPSGWCVMFAYGSIENKLRPFEVAQTLRDTGLHLVDIIAINRPWWGGKRSDTHLALSHEYVFLFSKNSKWYLDRAPVYSLLTGAKYEEATCPGNSWDLKNYNPAENYAADLAQAIMKMICLLPGSVVMDPFMGGSAGIEAATACGHSFIGFETDQARYSKYSKVLKKVQKRIEERDDDHSRGAQSSSGEAAPDLGVNQRPLLTGTALVPTGVELATASDADSDAREVEDEVCSNRVQGTTSDRGRDSEPHREYP